MLAYTIGNISVLVLEKLTTLIHQEVRYNIVLQQSGTLYQVDTLTILPCAFFKLAITNPVITKTPLTI